jgi:glycosyltransferase involved in cell wall biosynthesis
MHIFYIYKKIPHHAAHSGYDQLVKYVPSKSLSPFLRELIEKVLNRIPEDKLKRWTWVGGWYKRESLAKEIQIALSIPFRKGIYNYLYGEDDFHWGGNLPFRSGSKIVVTYHQPPSIFDDVIKDKSFIASADALIVCGTNQVEYFEQFTGKKNVYYVPHGVDTDYFVPLESKPANKRFNTISVGWWLRDVEMIKSIIRKTNEENLDVEFNIITFPEYFDYYDGLRNINLFTGISDDELKQKYQLADALLLPMKDCTANNAVLEAMACGVPVLTTDVGGIRGYVDDTCGFMTPPGDDQALFLALKELLNNPRKKQFMGKTARIKALEFNWHAVGKKMMGVYDKIWVS